MIKMESMNKSDMIKIAVVVIALLFITQQFYYGQTGLSNLFGGGTVVSQNQTGTAVFNGTIRTYDPLLGLPTDTGASVFDQLKTMDGVKGIKNQANFVIVETETRDDVYPLAVFLRQRNVTVYAVANVALPSYIDVSVGNGRINASTMNSIVKVQMEPLIDAGNDVAVQMVATVSDNQLVAYQSPLVMVERVSLQANATIAALDYTIYSYIIPWENRTSIGNETGYDYRRVDAVYFSPQLGVSELVTKRQLPYITYIDAGSAVVSPSFDNATRMTADFPAVNLTFPDSRLLVRITNATAPELPFNATVSYLYTVTLPAQVGGYATDTPSLALETAEEHELNTTIQMNISALVMGNRIVSLG